MSADSRPQTTGVGRAGQAPLELSVIVMAFNEVESLEAVVRDLQRVLNELKRSYEIVLIDDGSVDGTGLVAERLTEELACVRVVHHLANHGLGAVYRTGFVQATGEWLSFVPADGQFPASILKQFVRLRDSAEMILGDMGNRNRSRLARSLSGAEKALYGLLFGRLPAFQGILMFRRRLLDELPLTSTGRGWGVLMELIIRAARAGCRIVSVPIEACPRRSGASKVNNLSTIWSNLVQVMALRRHLSSL